MVQKFFAEKLDICRIRSWQRFILPFYNIYDILNRIEKSHLLIFAMVPYDLRISGVAES